MSDQHPWSDIPTGGGAYFKFESEGDNVKGVVTRIGRGTDYNGNPCPEFDLDTGDGETVTVSAGQAQLKRLIMAALPQVGDTVVIVYTHDEKTTKGSNMKCFDVAVKAGDGAASTDEPALTAKPATSAADLL